MSSEVEGTGADAFVRNVAANIRRLRTTAGMTLSDLASAARIGKSTLAQLESGRANPNVETLWAIASALRVPFGRLVEEDRPALRVVRAAELPVVQAAESEGWAGRLLASSHGRGTFDLYAIDLEPGTIRHADAHHAGVVEHMVVVSGRMRVGPRASPVELGAGDLVSFAADVDHVYEALEASHVVMLTVYP